MAAKGYLLQSELVQQFGELDITGDVIPNEFFELIRFPATERTPAQPDLLAILILSNLLYWFRPTRNRDQRTDKALPWRQKFAGEWLDRDYQTWADKFGSTERRCREACGRLKKAGWLLIKVTPFHTGGSKTSFQLNFNKIKSALFLKSRLTVERESARPDSRLNVSRLTVERESSFLHEINTLDYSSSRTGEYRENAAAAASSEPVEEHASNHSFGTILAYVRATKTGVKNAKGLARTIWRNGGDDDEIDAWQMRQTEIEQRKESERAKAEAETQRAKKVFDYVNSLSDDDYRKQFEAALPKFKEKWPSLENAPIAEISEFCGGSVEELMFDIAIFAESQKSEFAQSVAN